MTMDGPTVVAWNGSPSSRNALLWAIDRERHRTVGLLLLTVIDTHFEHLGSAAMDELVVAGTAALDAERTWIAGAAPEVPVSTMLLEGRVEEALTAQCPADSLLAVGADESHRWPHEWSLAARLASAATPPVVIVRDSPDMRRAGVVVGVDGSPTSLEAARLGATEAEARGDILHLVYASPDLTRAAVHDDHGRHSEEHAILDDARRDVSSHFPTLRIEQHLDEDSAEASLLRHSGGARLVVVGSRQRGPIQRLMLGSVSQFLARTATCPLMIVKPHS